MRQTIASVARMFFTDMSLLEDGAKVLGLERNFAHLD